MKRGIRWALLVVALFSAAAAWAGQQVSTFYSGLTSPTGIALSRDGTTLYVNHGGAGTLWAIPIRSGGVAGSAVVLTNGFHPTLDIDVDALGNVYGTYEADRNGYLCRASESGEVASDLVSYDFVGTGVTTDFPGVSDDLIWYTEYISPSGPELEGFALGGFGSYTTVTRRDTCYPFAFLCKRRTLQELLGTYGGSLYAVNPSNGSCSALLTGLESAGGIAEDEEQNVYVADRVAGAVYRITPLGKGTTLVTGLSYPTGLAYDEAYRRLLVSETGTGKILAVDLTYEPGPFYSAAYIITRPGGLDQSFVRVYNGSGETVQVRGTLYGEDGSVLGVAGSVLLEDLDPGEVGVLSSAALASACGASTWSGRAWLEVEADVTGLQVMNLVRTPSGLLTNVTRPSASRIAYNIPNRQSADAAYIRIYNTSEKTVQVTGTLYSQSGAVLGRAGSVLVSALAPKAVAVLTAADLEAAAGASPWEGRAWLRVYVTGAEADLVKVVNLIRSRTTAGDAVLINMSECADVE
jgi:DNA-binding beta-propeller fold protein YncE